MHPLVLAVLLAADPAPAAPLSASPATPPARGAPTAAGLAAAQALEEELLAPDDVQLRRLSAWRPRFRTGLGASGLVDVDGLAPQGEVGLDFRADRRLGVRVSAGGAVRIGWGVFSVAPEAVLRLGRAEGLLSPYVAAGVQLAVLNIRDDMLGVRRGTATARAAATSTPTEPGVEQQGGAGDTPLSLSVGPQATAGVAIRLSRRFALDVAARYTLPSWRSERYSGLGGLVALSAAID
jgi:hypothetical protein